VTVLVTGGAGFIGSHLAEALLASGDAVVALDAFTDYYDVRIKREQAAQLVASGVTFVEADLRNAELDRLLDGVRVVYHLAAQPGVRASWDERFAEYATHNVLGTQRLLEAARHAGVDRLIHASSSSIYGNALTYPTFEDVEPAPFSPYGVTKLAAEHLCLAYAQNFGLRTICLRYFTVYGPRQRPDMSVHRIIEAALGGPAFPLYGDGTQVREITYVDDVVGANLAAGHADVAPGATFNIAGGAEVGLMELIERVGDLVGRPVPVERRRAEPGDVRRNSGATKRAHAELGWSPHTSLDDGLRAQLDWHRARADAV
jgi:UDP-glucuronate 4-epimerase